MLVRRSYRDGEKVRHETLANLSKLPAAIEAALKGQRLVAAGGEFTIARALEHGDVAAVAAMARKLGMPGLLGPRCRSRDLALGLIISRVVRPASKLDTLSWWPDTTLGVDLGITGASGSCCELAAHGYSPGCSATGRAVRWRCGCSPATPPIPRRSPRS